MQIKSQERLMLSPHDLQSLSHWEYTVLGTEKLGGLVIEVKGNNEGQNNQG